MSPGFQTNKRNRKVMEGEGGGGYCQGLNVQNMQGARLLLLEMNKNTDHYEGIS